MTMPYSVDNDDTKTTTPPRRRSRPNMQGCRASSKPFDLAQSIFNGGGDYRWRGMSNPVARRLVRELGLI